MTFEELNKVQPRTWNLSCKIVGYDKIGMGKSTSFTCIKILTNKISVSKNNEEP